MPQKLQHRTLETGDKVSATDLAAGNKAIIENAMRIAADDAVKDVGIEKFTCYLCGRLQSRKMFYASSDRRSKTGVSRVCRECAGKIARNAYEDGVLKEPTVESIHEALEYIDRPWIATVYGVALNDVESATVLPSNNANADLWDYYVWRINNEKYDFMRFCDSDDFSLAARLNAKAVEAESDELAKEEYEHNRQDVIRLIGYDPFENYPVSKDKPQLYAQLISFIDEETKSDGMKMGAVIQIVKKLNQAEKLNDQLDLYVNDGDNAAKNMVLIDRITSSSKKLMEVANSLAKDNGISVNFNNNKSAGASTLSGKIKKLTEVGLRSAKINTFDIGTCEGMKQVAEISEAARHKRIGYDENIAAEIRDIKVELVEQMTKERDEAKERARLLLQENRDLKDYLKIKGLLDENGRGIE